MDSQWPCSRWPLSFSQSRSTFYGMTLQHPSQTSYTNSSFFSMAWGACRGPHRRPLLLRPWVGLLLFSFGWVADCPLALFLYQGSQLRQLYCVSCPVASRSPVALGHQRSLVRQHLAGTSGPSGFSLGKGWGLSAPRGRELPVVGDRQAEGFTGGLCTQHYILRRWRQPVAEPFFYFFNCVSV